MVFLPSRTAFHDGSLSDLGTLSHTARLIVDLLDVVTNVRDGDHLQYIVFLAQEMGLLAEPHLLFGTIGTAPRRPHSLLLESHFHALLREGVIDVNGTGRLRLRRDLYPVPFLGLANRRLSAMSALSPGEAAIFAQAVLHLAQEGRYAGSHRHDGAFRESVIALTALDEDGAAIDTEAICATRQRLLPSEWIMLTPM